MTQLTRWTGDGLDVHTGTATYTFGERVLQVRLQSFADAQAINDLFAVAARQARESAARAWASYIRAAATHLEHSE